MTEFLQTKGETRSETAEIPPAELNELFSKFTFALKEGQDYEPSSPRVIVSNFEMHLKSKSYPVRIINDLAFERLRKTLHWKQKQLKKKGNGNKPHASVALTEDEIKITYEKGLLDASSPVAILNTLCLSNILHFGLLGIKEHHDMRWGDVKLCNTIQTMVTNTYSSASVKSKQEPAPILAT